MQTQAEPQQDDFDEVHPLPDGPSGKAPAKKQGRACRFDVDDVENSLTDANRANRGSD